MDLNIQHIFVLRTYISGANLAEIGLDFKTYRNLSAIATGAELDSCVQPEWPEYNYNSRPLWPMVAHYH